MLIVQGNIGPADREHGDCEQSIEAMDLGGGVHCSREQEENRHSDERSDGRDQHCVGDDPRLRFFRIG
jgi:hypothetical protein